MLGICEQLFSLEEVLEVFLYSTLKDPAEDTGESNGTEASDVGLALVGLEDRTDESCPEESRDVSRVECVVEEDSKRFDEGSRALPENDWKHAIRSRGRRQRLLSDSIDNLSVSEDQTQEITIRRRTGSM